MSKQKMSREEFLEKVSCLEMSEDRVIKELTEELYHYERKYKMRTEIFFKVIVGTPAEDTPDFLAWASCYRSYFQLFQSKFDLGEIASNV